MNKARLLSLGLMLCAPGLIFAAMQTPTPSQITAATVYTDRAIVTRTATVQLQPGQTEVVLEKLPAGLVDDSLQVSGKGTAAATILDVTTRTTYVSDQAEVDQPRVNELRKEIELLQKSHQALNERREILEHQGELLGRIEGYVIAEPPADSKTPRSSIEELQKLLVFSRDSYTKLATEKAALQEEQNEVQEKLSALSNQLNQMVGHRQSSRAYKTVVVRVDAAKAGALDLNLSYTVGGASWTPAYDARLRAEERVVDLSYFGIVRQGTGEDWSNIALTLSTAKPSLGGAAPTLQPWFLDVFVPRTPAPMAFAARAAKQDKESAKMLSTSQSFNSVAEVAAPVHLLEDNIAEVGYAAATVDTSATSASFKIAAPATIPSDNTPQKVSIATVKLAANVQYQATPAMMEAAFLSTYVTNSTEYPLLAGSANTFLDDAFIATTTLKTVMPGEKFELSLGADEGIAIKRRMVNRFAEDTGLTSKGRRVTYEYLLTITNNKKTTERVVFKEVLPVSRNEKIVVKLLTPVEKEVGTKDKPGREVTREEDNKLVWRIDMKPGEKREIPLKFSVDYPGDIQVVGLE